MKAAERVSRSESGGARGSHSHIHTDNNRVSDQRVREPDVQRGSPSVGRMSGCSSSIDSFPCESVQKRAWACLWAGEPLHQGPWQGCSSSIDSFPCGSVQNLTPAKLRPRRSFVGCEIGGGNAGMMWGEVLTEDDEGGGSW
jgi:hypothetical protein